MNSNDSIQNNFQKDGWPVNELEEVSMCPLCDDPERHLIYSDLEDVCFRCAPGSWSLYQCLGCGCAYLNPRPTPATIGRAYQGYYTHSPPEDKKYGGMGYVVVALRNGYLNRKFGYRHTPAIGAGRYILPLLPPPFWAEWDYYARHLPKPANGANKLLDVGAGNGDFLARASEAGWQVEGLEPDPHACTGASSRGLKMHQGNLTNIQFPDNYFDVVTLSHVIEHVHDPVDMLQSCFQIIKPGGLLWLATPNLGSLGHSHYRNAWHDLDPPRHLVLFNCSTIEESLRKAGFVSIRFRRRGYHVARILAQSEAISRGDMPDRHYPRTFSIRVRSVIYEIIDWFKPCLAEELVVTARKSC